MFTIVSKLRKFFTGKEEGSLVEYGLLVALIAVACIAAMEALGVTTGLFTGSAASSTPRPRDHLIQARRTSRAACWLPRMSTRGRRRLRLPTSNPSSPMTHFRVKLSRFWRAEAGTTSPNTASWFSWSSSWRSGQ